MTTEVSRDPLADDLFSLTAEQLEAAYDQALLDRDQAEHDMELYRAMFRALTGRELVRPG
jgi:outer membrane protein TolC